MDFPELSLAPTHQAHHHHHHHHVGGVNKGNNIGSGLPFDHPYSEANASRKRKLFQDHHGSLLMKTTNSTTHQPSLQAASVDLQLKDPLPLDWEQCLDLESGKMYYLNRKTLRKSWNWPIPMEAAAAALDLELNISTFSDETSRSCSDHTKRQYNSSSLSSSPSNNSNNNNNNNNMVALACLNCHLLVILSKSSPACPNCKYVHSLPSHNGSSAAAAAAGPEPKVAAVKSLSTLSLLN